MEGMDKEILEAMILEEKGANHGCHGRLKVGDILQVEEKGRSGAILWVDILNIFVTHGSIQVGK